LPRQAHVWVRARKPRPPPSRPRRGSTQRYPAAARGKADASAALRLSEQFQTVPLFRTVKTDAGGRAVVEFEAPANLGAFSVRAYAVSLGVKGRPSKYGGNETKLVVRLPVSLTPALPRRACARVRRGPRRSWVV
jgi:uncharacterized protein YfaS (alpha-2-macroglobulin family)